MIGLVRAFKNRPAYTLMRGPARFAAVRRFVASAKAALTRRRTARMLQSCVNRRADSVFNDVDVDRFLTTLSRDGVAEGLKLPSDEITEITRWAGTQPVYGMRDPKKGFWLEELRTAEDVLGESIILAQYFNAYRDCVAIKRLAEDPLINLIALSYLGSEPKFLGANLWWTFPGQHSEESKREHAQFFHRDVDDFKFIKFFFYLTDVSPGEGGHWVVKGSHLRHPYIMPKDWFVIRRFEDREIAEFYPPESINEITGTTGRGFAEDTLCVHKAGSPALKPRLALQLQYGLYRYEKPYDEIDPAKLRMCKLAGTNSL